GGRVFGHRTGSLRLFISHTHPQSVVILSEAKDLCIPSQLHRSFAAKDAAQDDNPTETLLSPPDAAPRDLLPYGSHPSSCPSAPSKLPYPSSIRRVWSCPGSTRQWLCGSPDSHL